MKKLSMILVVMMMASIIVAPIVLSESKFEVKNIEYDGFLLSGEAVVPEGEYFVRVTMYLEANHYIVVTAPIENEGTFNVHIASHCEYITVAIVDKIDAFVPGTFHVYAYAEKHM